MKTILASLSSGLIAAVIAALVVLAVDDDAGPQPAAPPSVAATQAPQEEEAQATSTLVAREQGDPSAPEPPTGDAAAATQEVDLSPFATFDPGQIFEEVSPSVVAIETNRGSGSGFFVDDEGHVVTNFHVIQGATAIAVINTAGERADAQLLGVDTANDLAVLRIDPDEMTPRPVTIADSDDVRVGEPVAAIGSPFNLQNSLTIGVVSALERDRPAVTTGGRPQRGLIQTDAPVNPGNSGGVLLNADGELIGVTNSVESPVRGSVGIGFAISSNTLARFLPDLMAGMDIQHPWLGVALDTSNGVVAVQQVVVGSPAALAGLQAGDVLLRAEGAEISSFADLANLLDEHAVGEELAFVVQRGGQEVTLTVELGPWPG